MSTHKVFQNTTFTDLIHQIFCQVNVSLSQCNNFIPLSARVCLVPAIVETLHLKNICHQTWTGTKGVIKTSSWDRYSAVQSSLSLSVYNRLLWRWPGDPLCAAPGAGRSHITRGLSRLSRPGPSFTVPVFGVRSLINKKLFQGFQSTWDDFHT